MPLKGLDNLTCFGIPQLYRLVSSLLW
jgi:hypothetical protein